MLSENQKVIQRIAGVKPANALGEQRCDGKKINLGSGCLAKRSGCGIGNNEPIDCGLQKDCFRAWHEQAVCHQSDHPLSASMPRGAGGAQERAASADKIVDHKCSGSLDLANEKVA
jgi:hypothetical protein